MDMVEPKKLKKYQVNYHRRGEGTRQFNLMWTVVDAISANKAVEIAKKKLGHNWVVEDARRRY